MSRADLESLRAYLENLKQKYIQPLENELERIESIAKGAQGAQSFDNYSSMITKLNSLSKNSMNVGANILIVTLNVPDLWVSEIADESVPYLYVNDEYFVNELSDDGKIQVGYFVLSPLETLKVNLGEYVKFTDKASSSSYGVMRTYHNQWSSGLTFIQDMLVVYAAEKSAIDAKVNTTCPIVPFNQDYAWKVSATTNTETWTDEEKAKACETIGAVRKINRDANYCYTSTAAGITEFSAIATANTIALRSSWGTLEVGTPTRGEHATPKSYVDNLPDYLELTEEQKAKWRAWLGIE